MSAQPPEKLGKYEVVKEIARGSMGVVYEGYDPFIERRVALKVAITEFLREKDSGARFRKMFFNEAQTAGMLHHPNILEIFDAGIDGDTCYIVMELIERGSTLKYFCRPTNLLPVTQAVELIYRCAKALDHAHRQGVIHRDIKPTNILLTVDTDVKIADFSIAHVAQADLAQTMPMGFVGSPRYMSPEQIQEDVLTSQSDLFSLGIVFYELLTGRHPFVADSFSRLVYKIIHETPPPVQDLRPELPPVLNDIIARSLAKDLRARYRTGMELAIDLSAAFSHLEQPQQDISDDDKFARLRRLDFFRDFSDVEIWEILRAGIWQESPTDTTIIAEGELEDFFFVLVEGVVRVRKNGQNIGRLATGACFGEMGYLSRTRRSASVVADGPVSLLKLNTTVLEQVTRDCQLNFSNAFIRVLCERLAQMTAAAAHK
ncbi:MAG: protein kinase [Gammaproteobacteria bacterium]|nr:protein kinase [Gammaproteobacteria bacterium]